MSDATAKILITCPMCQKQYRVPTSMVGKQTRCKCGTTFLARPAAVAEPSDVLPAEIVVSSPVQASSSDCAFHPGTQALFLCANCRKLLCRKCSFSQSDGRHLCGECAVRSASRSGRKSQSVVCGRPVSFLYPYRELALRVTPSVVQFLPGPIKIWGAVCSFLIGSLFCPVLGSVAALVYWFVLYTGGRRNMEDARAGRLSVFESAKFPPATKVSAAEIDLAVEDGLLVVYRRGKKHQMLEPEGVGLETLESIVQTYQHSKQTDCG